MGTEGVNVAFTEEALDKIAEISFELNMTVENIGARRLLSVLEKVMEDIAFNAPEEIGDVVVTDEMVQVKLEEMLNTVDLKKYLL